MKTHKSLIIGSFLLLSGMINAQIGLGTPSPDASSVLDMNATNKGVLFPRMTTAQRNGILLPATGLMVYNIEIDAVEVNIGIPPLKEWISVTGKTGPAGPAGVVTLSFVNSATANGALAMGGVNNVASGVYSAAVGGNDNKAIGDKSVAFGGELNKATGNSSSAVGGTSNEAVSANSSAIGGRLNSVTGVGAAALGGLTNMTVGAYSCMVGGELNQAGAPSASVIGGSFNYATGENSTVIGGQHNAASAPNSGVFAGTFNSATANESGVLGGNNNLASAVDAVVLGGTFNTASGANAGVIAGTSNLASGVGAVILGGDANTASGISSLVSGGTKNFAVGDYSTVSGGNANTAKSYGEWVGGLYGTDYLAGSTTSFVGTDRLFNLGNGTLLIPSDAFTILKNGLAFLPGVNTAMILADASGKAIVTKEYADANYGIKTTAPVVAPLATDTGKIGEIRVMADYIYAYVALNTWVRFKNDAW
jgi:hypothetical protein